MRVIWVALVLVACVPARESEDQAQARRLNEAQRQPAPVQTSRDEPSPAAAENESDQLSDVDAAVTLDPIAQRYRSLLHRFTDGEHPHKAEVEERVYRSSACPGVVWVWEGENRGGGAPMWAALESLCRDMRLGDAG